MQNKVPGTDRVVAETDSEVYIWWLPHLRWSTDEMRLCTDQRVRVRFQTGCCDIPLKNKSAHLFRERLVLSIVTNASAH